MSLEGPRLYQRKLETIMDVARTNESATLTAMPKVSSQGHMLENGIERTSPDLKLDEMFTRRRNKNYDQNTLGPTEERRDPMSPNKHIDQSDSQVISSPLIEMRHGEDMK
jgi:hypothetical protein